MKLTELIIEWRDTANYKTVVHRRPVPERTSEYWLEGYLAGIAEMISYRGGHIIQFKLKEITCAPSQEQST